MESGASRSSHKAVLLNSFYRGKGGFLYADTGILLPQIWAQFHFSTLSKIPREEDESRCSIFGATSQINQGTQ